MNQQEIIDYLKENGYSQYFGFENILVKDNHSVTIEPDQILFECENTGYQDYEDLDYFENLSDILSWVDGSIQFLEEEEDEEE